MSSQRQSRIYMGLILFSLRSRNLPSFLTIPEANGGEKENMEGIGKGKRKVAPVLALFIGVP
jgi:hypothetical protein